MRIGLKEKGFTLVELAIVMVIIGLLIGAVLKGQAMIETAKTKNLADQYNNLVAAIYSYQDKYGALPGDDDRAESRSWAGDCDVENGDGSGSISAAEGLAANEHLACSGLIKGSYDGDDDDIKHTFGGNVTINYATNFQGKTGNSIDFEDLLAENAETVDRILDDGVYNTGSCRASDEYEAGTSIDDFRCFF